MFTAFCVTVTGRQSHEAKSSVRGSLLRHDPICTARIGMSDAEISFVNEALTPIHRKVSSPHLQPHPPLSSFPPTPATLYSF